MEKFNICLVQPDNYIHTMAFLELSELIHYSLLELGYESILSTNSILPNFKNILIGCHLLDSSVISKLPSNTIILNTEQVYGEATPWSQNIFTWARNFEIWDYSTRNIEKFNDLDIQGVKHFKIGFQKELVRLDNSKPKEIDVLFYGCINERRKVILDELIAKGLKVKTLFGVYGKERDQWIERSKIVLNHHFYDSHIFEIVRVFYLLTNSVAVVGEVNESTSIDSVFKNGIYSGEYSFLVTRCIELVQDNLRRDVISNIGFSEISKNSQSIFTKNLITN
jgi:hypothetical protein